MIDVNPVPEEFLYDPVSKSYGDPSRRPECKVTIRRAAYLRGSIHDPPSCSPRQSNSSRRPSTCCGPRSPPSTSFAWTYPVPRWRPDTSRLSVIRWQKSWTSCPATRGRRSVRQTDIHSYIIQTIQRDVITGRLHNLRPISPLLSNGGGGEPTNPTQRQ